MFLSFFLALYKKKKKVLIFGEEYIIKDNFHIYEKSINIDKVDMKKLVLSNKESY